MSAPSCFRSSMLRSCSARNSGSWISLGGRTCAPATETTAHKNRRNRLILRIDRASTARGRIGDRTNIGYQCLDVRLAERVSPCRHERRFVESRAPLADDGREIGVADLIESVAFGERMRLDFQVVVIRNALDRRFGVVAALAVLIVEVASEGLLVAEGDLFEFQLYLLVGLVGCGCDELVATSHASERYVGGDLTARIGEPAGGIESNSGGGRKFHEGSGDRGSLLIVHLDHDGLRQQAAGLGELLSAAGFYDGGAESCGLGQRC